MAPPSCDVFDRELSEIEAADDTKPREFAPRLSVRESLSIFSNYYNPTEPTTGSSNCNLRIHHTNMQRMNIPGRDSTVFHTAPSHYGTSSGYAHSFTTVPSRPGQNKPFRKPTYSKLQDLFKANGIKIKKTDHISGDRSKIRTLGEILDEDLEDDTYDWCGFLEENDWCGLGMHVDLKKGDTVQLEPLNEVVGQGATAMIDVVLCRGIRLARKTVFLRRGLQLRDVLKEVRALHELRHAHIIRLVGTYSSPRSFNMLLYPVADQNLADYLMDVSIMDRFDARYSYTEHIASLLEISVCLISAVRYIHKQGIKHMDIKPQNILIKEATSLDRLNTRAPKRMFLCDFGIAHIFESQDASKTDSYPGRTPKYAAPEVTCGGVYGRAADVFSLGCVLAEINTVVSGQSLYGFDIYRKSKPYSETIPECQAWLKKFENTELSTNTIALMLKENPSQRPRLFEPSIPPLPAREKLDDSKSTERSKDTTPDLSRAEMSIITQCCSHDLDEPEPYIYDKPYHDIDEASEEPFDTQNLEQR
jgi:serine/threonine protein kinase